MAASFAFSFSGDDIESDSPAKEGSRFDTHASPKATSSAFPVQGKPLLPPARHELYDMLARLPSKIAYRTLEVRLDSGEILSLPQRELWDVRAQIMAEDDPSGSSAEEADPGLGKHDVKSGIYEGGFKSWESSVDLVKAIAQRSLLSGSPTRPSRVVEVRHALPGLHCEGLLL
jgi:protein-histidine N-methyltransferase